MSDTGTATTAAVPRAGTVEVLVGLLAELDEATESGVFYDRVCRAVCSLTTMRRAAVLLYDDTYRAVVPAGSFGVDPELAKRIEGTLDETPLARKALEEDRVILVRGELSGHVPSRYAGLADTACITCTPISAARRWLGVIFADREGEDFSLDDGERETMMTLGRMAALTASVEHSTEQRESERRLTERVELTRELHENAIQRLFGVALALGSEDDLSAAERKRCQDELRSVVGDLRHALTRPLAPARPTKACLSEVLGRLLERRPEMRLRWEEGVEVPTDLEPLAQSVLAEALRNADRHAHPSEIEVRVASTGDTFSLAVQNDGARDDRSTKGGGLGLRLAALEALRYEGLVEFGSLPGGRWRVRLVVPTGER
jgi:signal transduction histidine kinase